MNAENLIQAMKLWFHHHHHSQRDFSGQYINFCPHNIPPKVEIHCQVPSSLVHWSYLKKTTHSMYCKVGGVAYVDKWLDYWLTGNQWCASGELVAYSGITQVVSLNISDLFHFLFRVASRLKMVAFKPY